MKQDNSQRSGPEADAMAGLCASLAALVIALDEAGVLHRRQYGQILQHFRSTLRAHQAEPCGGETIDRVIDLVREHGPGLADRYPDLDHIRLCLSAVASENAVPGSNVERRGDDDSRRRHAPLLGAPFVV